MRVEVKTRTKWREKEQEFDWIVDLLLVPRGSGNRHIATGLGKVIRNHPRLKDHIRTLKVGVSKVSIHFRPTFAMSLDLLKLATEVYMKKNDPNQLPLFPDPAGVT